MSATTQTKSMLIIKLKSPRVSILRGKVRAFKTGFIRKLTSPKTTPIMTKVLICPLNSTPGTNLIAKYNPKIPETI